MQSQLKEQLYSHIHCYLSHLILSMMPIASEGISLLLHKISKVEKIYNICVKNASAFKTLVKIQ